MSSTFFDQDQPTREQQIVDALYDRLSAVRRVLDVRVDRDDEFEQGINCRASNEQYWLETLLDKIERS